MDVPRPFAKRNRRRRRIFAALIGLVAIGAITMGVTRLKPAIPSVERSGVWVDAVKRGSMVRQVRGLGTLTPDEIRWIPTLTDGRVEKILLRPGTPVKSDTLLVILSNPAVEQLAFDAEWKLRAEQAQYHNLEVTLQSQVLDQEANTAKAEQDAEIARMKASTDAELAKVSVISEQARTISAGNARSLTIRADIEKKRYANAKLQLEAQLAAEQAKVEEARAVFELQKKQKSMLQVRGGMDGILQELSYNGNALQEGEQIPAGTTIAKVANPKRLKAELKIPETQVKDVQVGQAAQIDTHNGLIQGRVVRIDPSVQNGTRTVDVALDGDLPAGAVPDLSVDGTIDLERIPNGLFVSRPAFGEEKSTIAIFKLEPDGKTASRVQVNVGRSSVNSIEILRGLQAGDQVILSDMSRWDQYERIRLE
jgi:HlyD family secretion protein